MNPRDSFSSIDDICEQLRHCRYITDQSLATVLYLSYHLHKPMVVITSNRTRDVHDALKRRCLFHWIDYPDLEKELKIIQARVPDIDEPLAHQVAIFMQNIRREDLLKKPGISESLDWAEALLQLNRNVLNEETVEKTLGCILKYHEDIEKFRNDIWTNPDRRTQFLSESCM